MRSDGGGRGGRGSVYLVFGFGMGIVDEDISEGLTEVFRGHDRHICGGLIGFRGLV